MRELETLTNGEEARQFGAYLTVNGIKNMVEEDEGEWVVWIESEDDLDIARSLLKTFREHPNIGKDPALQQQAKAILEKEQQEQREYQKRMKEARAALIRTTGTARVTFFLIIVSVAVTLLTGMGRNLQLVNLFSITKYEISGNLMRWQPGLPEIFHGQVWRLLTPIFIHYGIIHIFFNMLWLRDLGTAIERVQGVRLFIALVISIGILSNLGQYWVSGPNFGGMSGVVYGLLGYIWMRGRFDPLSGLHLENWIVVMMIGWFFLGVLGIIGHMANMAHGVGLVTGMIWGYILARLRPTYRRR